MRRLTYVIGIPGAGKSTAMRAARERFMAVPLDRTQGFPVTHWVNNDLGLTEAIELGRAGGDFPGTDTLSFAVQPKVLEWLRYDLRSERIVAEGDRLSSASFFDKVKALGIDLRVVLLHTPSELAAQRRAERGSNQDERWVKGRETKVKNLEPYVTHQLEGVWTPEVLGRELRRIILD